MPWRSITKWTSWSNSCTPWTRRARPGDKARALSHKVRHHLREEESKFFQVSGKLLSNTQKLRLAAQYRKDFARMQAVAAAA